MEQEVMAMKELKFWKWWAQNRPGSNNNEGIKMDQEVMKMKVYATFLCNWILTARCILLLYPGLPFWEGLTSLLRIQLAYS